MKPLKLVSIVGARPQFVKLGPISRAIDAHNCDPFVGVGIEHSVVHTGQHYDPRLSDAFFRDIDLPTPQVNLEIGSGSHGRQTGRMMEALEQFFMTQQPDIVLVYGDTNSTLAAALAAIKLHLRVAHVEAGLRSYQKHMPEEINRILTDHVSSVLFCPTRQAVDNLEAEGLAPHDEGHALLPLDAAESRRTCSADQPLILNVGDVMYDVYHVLAAQADEQSAILESLHARRGDYALVTVHRAENTDDPGRLRGILEGLSALAATGLRLIFPVHPRTRKVLSRLETSAKNAGLEMIEPVGYLDMLALERNAALILTDSGGVQKEAFFSRVPCLTLREETEWVELVESGWNVLVGADPACIADGGQRSLGLDCSSQPSLLYGDGRAAERIVHTLAQLS